MSKAIEVITSVERRRVWSAAEKERLVAASLEPGSSVSAVAADSDDCGRGFRLNAAMRSDRKRPPVPIEGGRGSLPA